MADCCHSKYIVLFTNTFIQCLRQWRNHCPTGPMGVTTDIEIFYRNFLPTEYVIEYSIEFTNEFYAFTITPTGSWLLTRVVKKEL